MQKKTSTGRYHIADYAHVGIVGIPPLHIIRELNDHKVVIHDLDAKLVPGSIDGVTPYLPKVFCAILRTVLLNALRLELDAIFIDVGPGKCDAAFHVATVLEGAVSIPVFRTWNEDSEDFGAPLCRGRMDLTEKMLAITDGVKTATPTADTLPACVPTAGFWGVPPRDFSLLKPFPQTTHVYGWSRCMENKTPSNTSLEAYCNPDIPTVFFAQSFCAKSALAKYLADHHPHALYLDVDFTTTSSARAKVQAFLELSGAF